MDYYSEGSLRIRTMFPDDARVIYDTFLSYGWHPDLETYENYYVDQETGRRKVFIAEYDGTVAGYCTLVLKPEEGPWAGKGIPEIVDLSVFREMQRRGIGNALLDVVEAEAKKITDQIFLAVGLHSGYGAAQRIYVKRGYLPDGNGVWYRGKILEQYVPCCNDDDLLLFMSKKL